MIYKRLLKPPDRSFFLFGVRGAGKSTWARSMFPDALRIDLLDESIFQLFLSNPGAFAARIRSANSSTPIIVDEIQRLPNLLNEVHRAIEERGMRFILLGSSAYKLKRAGTNLLAGRASRRELYPLLPQELGSDFNLDQVIRYGSLPIVVTSADKEDTLVNYVQMYLKEEIQAEAVVRNLPAFARFLPVAALFHGQTINVSGIARDAQTARTTVEGYIQILEDTLLTRRLPAFQPRLRVREKALPKLYWVDPGIVRVARRALHEPTAQEKGHLFEGLVHTLLHAYNAYSAKGEARLFDELYYWGSRETKDVEVDFLLQRAGEFIAIEAKSSAQYQDSFFRGLRAIKDLKKLGRRIVVYSGSEIYRSPDGIEVLPLQVFEEALVKGF